MLYCSCITGLSRVWQCINLLSPDWFTFGLANWSQHVAWGGSLKSHVSNVGWWMRLKPWLACMAEHYSSLVQMEIQNIAVVRQVLNCIWQLMGPFCFLEHVYSDVHHWTTSSSASSHRGWDKSTQKVQEKVHAVPLKALYLASLRRSQLGEPSTRAHILQWTDRYLLA